MLMMVTSCMNHTSTVNVGDTSLTRSAEYQLEIDTILAIDSENKRWERVYLDEILAASRNNDQAAYKFYVIEFIKLPRMQLADWVKGEPNYTPELSSQEVLDANIRVIVSPATK